VKTFDELFANFQSLPLPEKIAFLSAREEFPQHMIFAKQLTPEFLHSIYELTNKLRTMSKTKAGADYLGSLLSHKRAMLYFNQPSSRTYLSFQNACHILGMKTSEIRDIKVSSEIKGESEDDAIRTFSSYTDIIIMRTKGKDVALRAAWMLNSLSNRPIPIINGGSGADEHPTQAILDIYTLQRSFDDFGGLNGKTIVMCGDLKRGRTVRSLSVLLANFSNIKIIFTAPSFFQMEKDVLDFLDQEGSKKNVTYEIETSSLHRHLPEADAVYMTRIQDEHDREKESDVIDMSKFKLALDDLKLMKPNAVIMHPFPRRDEIDVRIDRDPRAMYWRQERNGMWARAALISKIFNIDGDILRYP
jgi:aspartate carbamoyltransferase catalytic subunit